MPVIPHYPGDVWAGEVLLDPNTLERKGLFTFRTETIERGLVPPPAMRSARTEGGTVSGAQQRRRLGGGLSLELGADTNQWGMPVMP
jgi:hypothetical protein